MQRSSCMLEVTLISAEDLHIDDRSIKKHSFATIQTDPSNSQSTSMGNEGGSYSSWHEKFDVYLPNGANYVKIEVKCKISASVRLIGTANIPVSDFFGDYIPPTCLHFLSYRLREKNGEANGIVNLSIRTKGLGYACVSDTCRPIPYVGIQDAYNSSHGFAAGMPVHSGYNH
ncbi:hypothetical protein ACHQM5_000783 [Ranunculus cassubicifolius]